MANEMTSEDIQVVAFQIILHSGTARTYVHNALSRMREGEFDKAADGMKAANDELVKAHNSQTELLQKYASGIKIEMEIIMVHAQDHLMTTMTLKEMAEELEFVYKQNREIMHQLNMN